MTKRIMSLILLFALGPIGSASADPGHFGPGHHPPMPPPPGDRPRHEEPWRIDGPPSMGIGVVLKTDQALVSSNRRFVAIMQRDCNFVVYERNDPRQPMRALWSSRSNGRGWRCEFVVQYDRNLVVYNENHQAVWASNSNARWFRNGSLIMQDDGNLVLYQQERGRNFAVWATGTHR